MLWAMFTGLMFVRGQTEGRPSRVAVAAWPTGHADLKRAVRRARPVPARPAGAGRGPRPTALIRRGALDACVEFLPPAAGTARRQLPRARRPSTSRAIAPAWPETASPRPIDRYREAWLRREAAALAMPPAEWEGFAIEARNVASGARHGAVHPRPDAAALLRRDGRGRVLLPRGGRDGGRARARHVGDAHERGRVAHEHRDGEVPLRRDAWAASRARSTWSASR